MEDGSEHIEPVYNRDDFMAKMLAWARERPGNDTEEIASARRLVHDAFLRALRSGMLDLDEGMTILARSKEPGAQAIDEAREERIIAA